VNWLPADYTCRTCLRGFPNVCERLFTTTFVGLLPCGETRLTTTEGVKLKQYLSSATMAEYAVLDQAGVIPFPPDVPFDVAAITGCAVATGVGAVMNTAQVVAGSSAAVIGCGGVGLAALQGCLLAGCYPIVAVDVVPGKLEFAKKMGATDVVNAKETNPIKALRSLTHGGPDYVVDTVGSNITIPQAVQAIRPGGIAVIAGLHSANAEIPFSPGALIFQNKQLRGSFAGSIRPHLDLPKLIELYRGGRLRLNELVTRRYPLDKVGKAFEDMQAGTVARGVVIFE
jgi:Zn-dependent alcohol dehydrogenase